MSIVETDYVVIGAGSSGCALVHRLSSDPSIRVLILEAGISGETDPAVLTPGGWVSLVGSSYDWNYATEPESGLDQRRIGVPRGKAHGGSSTINAMAYVRGSRACFDRWRSLGNPGWGYDDLQPMFTRAERTLAVSDCLDPHASHLAFLAAATEQGFRADARHDFNGPQPEGVAGFYQKNILDGRRHSAAAAFLVPALARPNIEMCSPAQATRLLFEGRRVVGVEYLQEGRLERVRARREVVVCAGAVDSPRLLMLSGIGAADDLRALDIGVAADLPGVGRNLQDHPKLSIRWRGTTMLPGSTVTAGLFTSSSSASTPDLQFYVGRGLDQRDEFITITVALVQPRSRGTIGLRSADPLAAPVIRTNYLTDAQDVAALVEGVALARRLGDVSRLRSCARRGDRARIVNSGFGAVRSSEGRHDLSPDGYVSHGTGVRSRRCRGQPASRARHRRPARRRRVDHAGDRECTDARRVRDDRRDVRGDHRGPLNAASCAMV